MPGRSREVNTYREELANTLLNRYAEIQPYRADRKAGNVLTKFSQDERAKIYVTARLAGHNSTQDFIRQVVLDAVDKILPPVVSEMAENIFSETT